MKFEVGKFLEDANCWFVTHAIYFPKARIRLGWRMEKNIVYLLPNLGVGKVADTWIISICFLPFSASIEICLPPKGLDGDS